MATSPRKSAAAQAAAAPQAEPNIPNEIPTTASEAVEPNEFPTASEAVEAIVEPDIAMQEPVRSALQEGAAESRAAFVKAKVSADEVTNALELSFAAAKDGAIAFNAKALAAARANAEAGLHLIKAAFGVKSVADLVALQSDFARKQTDATVAQFKELAELAQKTAAQTIEPIRAQLTKAFHIAA